ncbi:hypothetical protein JCM19239_5580 [Vibrio variabilis]|uniref:DUF2986 domain-containing protein n=1 Tax=Vibrio variabilis TaxID=990271 RepID=A0ABQ0JEQ1_9VIBR|nr:hypothetical protein JCM19239_5580 [Vibrio variabilis]
MNRKKKINQILKAKAKKANAKKQKSNKPRYISKAERAKMEAEEASSQSWLLMLNRQTLNRMKKALLSSAFTVSGRCY